MIKNCFDIMMTLILINLLFSGSVLELKLEKCFEIGQDKIFFKSITSVYEDDKENIYVLDKKAYRIYKLSGNGNVQFAAGSRGVGPGDLLNPQSIYVTPEGNIIVNDSRDFVSVFDQQGNFLNRIKVSKGLDLNLMNNTLFYAWVWTEKGKQQTLIDKNGKIMQSFFYVDMDDFSLSLPDETGRLVMFTFFSDAYTPFFLFSRGKNLGIIGVSNKYEILLVNPEGKIIEKFYRDIKPGTIGPQEKEYFESQIDDNQNFPEYVKKKFVRKIPRYKNFFNRILIYEPFLWAFRIRDNVMKEDSPVKVDLFTIDNGFLGTLELKDVPLFISRTHIYFEETNSKEDLLLTKYKYAIIDKKAIAKKR